MDFTRLQNLVVEYGIRIVIGLAILFIGFKVVNFTMRRLGKFLEKRGYDPALRPFLSSLLSWTLKAAIFIVAANQMGIETTSFVALLGAAGLAIGIALQGSLSNFSGGVMLLLLKPFRPGDVIETQGFAGKVDKISIFNTVLKTADNQVIYLPNGPVANSPLKNVTQENTRMLDLVFGISYGDDIQVAKSVLREDFLNDPRILREPAPKFFVKELADSSVNIGARAWVKTSEYWDVLFDHTESVKTEFDAKGITIPFPQTDFNIRPESAFSLKGSPEQNEKPLN